MIGQLFSWFTWGEGGGLHCLQGSANLKFLLFFGNVELIL